MKVHKRKIYISIIAVIGLLALIGTSYAFYDSIISGNRADKTLTANSDIISIEFKDGSESFNDATVTQGGADVVPGSTYEKVFTVTNNSNGIAYFSIVLDELENTFQRNQDWTYTLTVNNEVISEGTIVVGTKQILVPKRSLAANETKNNSETYTFTLTYNKSNEDQMGDIGATLTFKINIKDETVTWDNPEAPSWAPVGSTTLLSKIKLNQPSGTTETIPGQVPSAEDEKRILQAEDDYGTSYVYRGNVENNYVNYSGMCWRIVRVQGDGTIKIVLADRDNECNEAGYSSTDGQSAFIANPSTQGFAYKYYATYTESDFIYENSDIRETLDAWLNGETYKYIDVADTNSQLDGTFTSSISVKDQEKLANAEWCNDLSLISKNSYDTGVIQHYGAYGRLRNISEATPSLKCNSVGLEESSALKYPSKIGILSADEFAFAGATVNESGVSWNYYLETNATAKYSLTLSPYNLDDGYPGIWSMSTDLLGCLDGFGVDDYSGTIRPAVVLRSDILLDATNNPVDEQDGTQAHPYEV